MGVAQCMPKCRGSLKEGFGSTGVNIEGGRNRRRPSDSGESRLPWNRDYSRQTWRSAPLPTYPPFPLP